MHPVRQAMVCLFAVSVCSGAGCDQPLSNLPPVPEGQFGQIQQAACPINSPTCINPLIDQTIDTCTPCLGCNSDSCATRVCNCDGTCSTTVKIDGTSCDDGNKCNGADSCKSGTCSSHGTAVVCAAIDRCHTVGTCTPATGVCTNPPQTDGTSCDDGNKCNGLETCQSGSCAAGTAVTCTALDRCHTVGTCDPNSGSCSNPAQPNGTSCDDGNKCNGLETCQGGSCSAGTAVACTVLDRCHGVGTCAPATGTCSNPTRADGVDCDDGNKCNGLETCRGGVCSPGTAVACTAKDGCHKVGTCDPASGACSNPLAPDGTSCGNDNKCSGTSACNTGVCTAGVAIGCPAQDKCHGAGSCDVTSGKCSNPALPDGTDCDDGDPCNGPEMCQQGVCVSGPPLSCVPPDACHTATCSQASGMCLYAVTGNCADGGLPVDAAEDMGSAGDGESNPDTDVTPDASANDAGASDGSIGGGGAGGAHPSDAGAKDGSGGKGAVIGPCSYTPGDSPRNPIVVLAVVWAAMRRRKKNRG